MPIRLYIPTTKKAVAAANCVEGIDIPIKTHTVCTEINARIGKDIYDMVTAISIYRFVAI